MFEELLGGGHKPKKTSTYKSLSNELKNRVEDKEIEGWEVLEVKNDRVVMGKNKKGGILKNGLLFFFTGWLTAGLGNVAYHEHKKKDIEKTVLREEKNNNDSSAVENLVSLQELKDSGSISEEEFDKLKNNVMGKDKKDNRNNKRTLDTEKAFKKKESEPGWDLLKGATHMHRKIDEDDRGVIMEVWDGNKTGRFCLQDDCVTVESSELDDDYSEKEVDRAKAYLKENVI
jgi:hypothetical protein